MNIRIGLTRAEYSCLLDKVAADSALLKPKTEADGIGTVHLGLTGAMPMGDEVQVYCSREEAEQLLEIAKQGCKDAVYSIKQALAGRP